MLLCTLYFSAVEQQLGFEHRDLGFRVGDRVVEDHLDRLVQRDLLHVDQLSLVGTALALLRDPAGIEVDDLVGIARGGISLTERYVIEALRSRLLQQLALAVFQRCGAFFELARGKLKNHLRVGIAELADEKQIVLLIERGDTHAARVADDLAHGGGAVGKDYLVVEHMQHAAVKYLLAACGFFCHVHILTSFLILKRMETAMMIPDYRNQVKSLNEICARFGLRKRVIGKSLCRRDIFAVTAGGGGRRCLLVGGVHGTEYLTVSAVLRFVAEYAEHPGGMTLTAVPCLNPDGTEIALHGFSRAGRYASLAASVCGDRDRWKANARGVDLNHNFDADWQRLREKERSLGINAPACTRFGGSRPESEPETRALVRLCEQTRFERVLALHSQGREIYWDFGRRTPCRCLLLAQRMAEVSGYTVASPDDIATGGGFKDWFIERFHRCGLTVEMGKGENPLPLSDLAAEYPRVRSILKVFTDSV